MPYQEQFPVSTAIVTAGWNNPTRIYIEDNSYATSSTDTAEQSYDYNPFDIGSGILDKVFVKIKYYSLLTIVNTGDTGSITFIIRVYDGTTWTNYQVTALTYACTTANDESLTSQDGDNSNNEVAIDVTSIINTVNKLQNIQTALLTNITTEAGVTPSIAVDSMSILVCYHSSDAVYSTGTAKTRKELMKESKALSAVTKFLKVTS